MMVGNEAVITVFSEAKTPERVEAIKNEVLGKLQKLGHIQIGMSHSHCGARRARCDFNEGRENPAFFVEIASLDAPRP